MSLAPAGTKAESSTSEFRQVGTFSGDVPTDKELGAVGEDGGHLGYGGWSDRELAAEVVLRSVEAHAELYRRHARSVTAAARTILGSGSECDDVAAEVFVGFWVAPGRFDPDRGSLLGFLRLQARGRSLDVLRSEKSRRGREVGAVFSERIRSPEVDSALLAADAAATLRRAVAALPLVESEAIYLAFFIGMPYRAAAFALKVPEGTVKSRIRSGLRRLRSTGDVHVLLDGGILPSVGKETSR